jgi:hypothetical protein
MTSRREFIRVGLAASTLPLTASAAWSCSASEAEPAVPLYKVLYDTRFPASLAFAHRVTERGVPVHAMDGDMTRFWYDDLYHRWQRGPAAIAGLTAYGALFCLERLAWDQRMRVVFRAEHGLAAAGCIAHEFNGPARMLRAAEDAAAEGAWAAAMADVVLACPRGRAELGATKAVTRVPSLTTLASEPLFSWVMAPVSRV